MSSPALTPQSPDLAGRDEQAVRAVLGRVYAAWAENDADAFVASYGDQATATLPGTRLAGRAEIRQTMAEVFAGPLKGSQGLHEVRHVRFIAAEVALVLSRGSVLLAGQTEPAPATATLDSWVLSREDGSWRVEGFHSTPASSE